MGPAPPPIFWQTQSQKYSAVFRQSSFYFDQFLLGQVSLGVLHGLLYTWTELLHLTYPHEAYKVYIFIKS